MSDDVTTHCLGGIFKHFLHTGAPLSKNGRVEGDSLAKNSLLMTCLENDQRFLSKFISHKILETIFCRNFV